MDEIHLKAYVPPNMRKISNLNMAKEQWKELPDAIIINEDVKELKAKRVKAETKMFQKAKTAKIKAKEKKENFEMNKSHREDIEA